ncbi:MAG: sugar phosphate nucleotidyltransferase [Candidatus Cloacimonadaceae bacterium]|jgi:bifunctional UDP-N-acetylglucosamine pyrophosphorylase/glucosamine-1-phosphate N-acetyltransferase|nr:NTP transferase domain-containing protein [Candidatus Cloacimonadota bacterium]MDX9950179.1 NTP transferase domain-containing protein [Candidatus Syntrophosphaera sp.]NLN85122.1 bifunctional N-acetylglucosamine-1-phosphate uridyltransferase/glucosamine-1-phosphate acetyltransferase [Candidatus Cloacimonadota bacterium]
MNHLTAIILAAGKGTRMNSNRAKVLFPIAGKAMVQRVVESAFKAGCQSLCVVVGHQKENVVSLLEGDPRISFAEQAQQLGTGHAVMMAQAFFQNPDQDVLVLSGDVPLLSPETLQKMHSEHLDNGFSCTVLTAFLDDPGKYGRILREPDGQISGIVEFKDATPAQLSIKEWNTGIYCFKSEDLFSALAQVSNSNNQQEYYLTDVLSILRSQSKKVGAVVLENLVEASGVNSQQQLAELEDQFVDSIRRRWLNLGVMIHNPQTVFIGEDVILEPDVQICQNCVIKGKSYIKSGSIIGTCSIIEDSRLGENCVLKGHNILVNATLKEGSVLAHAAQAIEDENQ